jgi:hypothetical protein
LEKTMTHTKEPWQVNFSDPTQICDCDGENRGCAPIAVMADGDDDAEANARRIVACVNACAGQPTELLEAAGIGLLGKSIDKIAAFHARSMTAEQQRDNLLAALKATLPLLKGHQETPEKVARYSNALAAIAEIENN